MGVFFNSDEVFEIAIQIEKNGAKFYKKAAQIVTDPYNKDLLLRLSEMEEDHAVTFESMLKEMKSDLGTMDNEVADYLKAMASGYVFKYNTDPSEAVSDEDSMEDIIGIALGLEKDSIAFYSGLRDIMPEAMGKRKIDAIIKEEYKHIVVLFNSLKSL